VGDMLRASNRSSWRPAHTHFVVSAHGYEPVTTHIFDDTDPYLTSDAVFAVKPSLMRPFEKKHQPMTLANGDIMPAPFVHADFDFVLSKA
jgi:hydroxyquinol 1,2-dioxygenase